MWPNAPVFPDTLGALIDYLDSHTYLTSFSVDRVSPNLNGYVGGERWVVVNEAPGTRPVRDRVDRLPFDLNCYAEDLEKTRELAMRALAAAVSMRGTVDSVRNVVVTATDVGITPFDLTDQLSNRYRYVSNVVLYVRPN